jgi:hypothetical protein
MTASVGVDYLGGVRFQGREGSILEVEVALDKARNPLASLSLHQIVDVFDEFGAALRDRSCLLHAAYPQSGLAYLAGWCRRSNLMSILGHAFGDYAVLDGFQSIGPMPGKQHRAMPRGVVVHWMAGNVPTLSFLSLILSVLCKNINIVKIASVSDDLLAKLLEMISRIEIDGVPVGSTVARSVAVVRAQHNDNMALDDLSLLADVRIFWGSDPGITALRSRPTKMHTSDLVFSAKTSFMLIDAPSLATADFDALSRRMAVDISVFEQKACASPHTLLLQTDDPAIIVAFAQALKKALEKTLAMLPKAQPSPNEVSAILNLRAQYDMFYQAWYSSGIEYTLLSDNEIKLGPAIGNRTVYIRAFQEIGSVASVLPVNIQSVGILASKENYGLFTTRLAEAGVNRFTRLGGMTQFEVPWDGYFIPQYLVKWCTRPAWQS